MFDSLISSISKWTTIAKETVTGTVSDIADATTATASKSASVVSTVVDTAEKVVAATGTAAENVSTGVTTTFSGLKIGIIIAVPIGLYLLYKYMGGGR